jgi:hypothetical protein
MHVTYQSIQGSGLLLLHLSLCQLFAFSGMFVLLHGFLGVGEEL